MKERSFNLKHERYYYERERHRRLEQDAKEGEIRRRKAADADAISAYKVLLAEMIKTPDITWEQAKPKLLKDVQVSKFKRN